MQHQGRTADEIIASLAAAAHGVVAHRELIAVGITPDEIRTRVKRGSLIRVHPGVYRVGHAAPSIEAAYMAAVKACGDAAVLSGEATAHLLGVKRGPAPPAEITAPTERRVNGVRTRRRDLPETERTTYNRIPCTTVARTIVDLAATLEPYPLSRAVHEAAIRHDLRPDEVEAILTRQPNTPGARTLRQIVSGEAETTLSVLERAFLKVLRKAKLPLPRTNQLAAAATSTAAGPSTGSPSNSTASASTTPATPGSSTAAVNVRPTRAATSSAATRGATWSSTPDRCSANSARCWTRGVNP